MPTIKFSHNYKKLKNHELTECKTASLLEVLPINLKDLSKPFLDYDTDNGAYPLPKNGDYLMLIFKKNNFDIFTTLRSNYPPNKLQYYKDNIGNIFDVEIIKENP